MMECSQLLHVKTKEIKLVLIGLTNNPQSSIVAFSLKQCGQVNSVKEIDMENLTPYLNKIETILSNHQHPELDLFQL